MSGSGYPSKIETCEQKYEIAPKTAAAGYQRAIQSLEYFISNNKALIDRLDATRQQEYEERKRVSEAKDRERSAEFKRLEVERERLGCALVRSFFKGDYEDQIREIDLKLMRIVRDSDMAIYDHHFDSRYSTQLETVVRRLRGLYAVGNLSATNLRLTKSEVAELQQMHDGTWLEDHHLTKEILAAGDMEPA